MLFLFVPSYSHPCPLNHHLLDGKSIHDPGEVQHLILHSALRDETKSWIALTSGMSSPVHIKHPFKGSQYVPMMSKLYEIH